MQGYMVETGKSLSPREKRKLGVGMMVLFQVKLRLFCRSSRLQLENVAAWPSRGEKKISRPKPQTIGGRDNYNCKLKPSRSGAIFVLTLNNHRDSTSGERESGFLIQVSVTPPAKIAFQTSFNEPQHRSKGEFLPQ